MRYWATSTDASGLFSSFFKEGYALRADRRAEKSHQLNTVWFDSLSIDIKPPTVAETVQENYYSAFGNELADLAFYKTDTLDYLFHGQRYDRESETYGYFARSYDPKIGRWAQFDPLANARADLTPYRFCYNNPLRYTDPSGMLEGNFENFWEFLEAVVKEFNNSGSESRTYFSDGEGGWSFEDFTAEDNNGKLGFYLLGDNVSDFQKIKGSYSGILFKDETKAYKYMWDNSFRKGKVYKESGAWITNKGVLVLSNKNNNGTTADMWILPTIKLDHTVKYVRHNFDLLKVIGAIHTHPNGLLQRVSIDDMNFAESSLRTSPLFVIGTQFVSGYLNGTIINEITTKEKLLSGEFKLIPMIPYIIKLGK